MTAGAAPSTWSPACGAALSCSGRPAPPEHCASGPIASLQRVDAAGVLRLAGHQGPQGEVGDGGGHRFRSHLPTLVEPPGAPVAHADDRERSDVGVGTPELASLRCPARSRRRSGPARHGARSGPRCDAAQASLLSLRSTTRNCTGCERISPACRRMSWRSASSGGNWSRRGTVCASLPAFSVTSSVSASRIDSLLGK